MRLKDKAVLITGAAHGIGRATLELFAKEGARLVACDIEEGPLREAAEAVGAAAHAEAGAEALDREIPLMITRPTPLARKDSGKALAQMGDSGPLS